MTQLEFGDNFEGLKSDLLGEEVNTILMMFSLARLGGMNQIEFGKKLACFGLIVTFLASIFSLSQ